MTIEQLLSFKNPIKNSLVSCLTDTFENECLHFDYNSNLDLSYVRPEDFSIGFFPIPTNIQYIIGISSNRFIKNHFEFLDILDETLRRDKNYLIYRKHK